jgi:hypothetical protein
MESANVNMSSSQGRHETSDVQTPSTMKDAFQKKVRNERGNRRMTRKRVARMAGIPSNGDHPLHLVQFTEVKNSGTRREN